jgi:hypothetical protein
MARLKLNKEEINSIQELQQRNNDILFQLGDAEVALRNLQIRKEELMKAWDELMTDDKSFGDAITESTVKAPLTFKRMRL